MAIPSQARVFEYFNYDPDTGIFGVKERPRSEFPTDLAYARHIRRLGKPAGSISSEGYLKLHIDSKSYLAHKIAWLLQTGEWVSYPENEIDHINGDPADNRWANIRKVSKSDNQRNSSQRINNTSGVHGVNWKPVYSSKPNDGRWVARIWNGPRHVYLGSFKSLRDAQIARKAAERVLGITGTERPPSDRAKQRFEKKKAIERAAGI